MKKSIHRILLAPTAALLLGTGCVNESRDSHDPVVRLAFEPVMHAQVRSQTDSGDASRNDSEYQFGVSVWSLDKESSWKAEARNAEALLTMEPLVRNGNLWFPETGTDWPSDQYNLSCIGFAPYGTAAECSPVDGVVFNGVDTSSDPGDLRYTEPQSDWPKNRNGGVIPLPMIPALCEVNFRIRGVSGYEATRTYVRRIVLDGAALRGSFHSLPEPEWTLDPQTGRLTFFTGDQEVGFSPANAGATLRIIPQELDGRITVDYAFETPAGGRLDLTEREIALKRTLTAGRRHTITLAISPAGVEVIVENPSPYE